MAENEPRALTAALAGPAFATRGGSLAMHVADRHVERWAPETAAGASRSRPLRSLGFVDRLISPWVEAAQRSASLRLFSQYQSHGMAETAGRDVSWVFPRPWYQDELDWMAASRRAATERAQADMPAAMLTTRGTYVAPAQLESMRAATTLPAALYEYVAPSLSVAEPAPVAGVGYGGETERARAQSRQAYSPLVSLAAVQAADLMSRTVARLPATVAAAPALRSVLSSLLSRTATTEAAHYDTPTRLSMQAPELVTPPAPREAASRGNDVPATSTIARGAEPSQEPAPALATQVAERYAAQHVQIAELQRIARVSAERQAVEQQRQAVEQQRQAAERQVVAAPAPSVTPRAAESPSEQAARVETARRAQQDAQQQIEERVARRVAERSAQRLHEQARSDAATHARAATLESTVPASTPSAASPSTATPSAPSAAPPPEFAAAIASLPPELAGMLSRRPDRAAQTIAELDQAYRTVELLARSAASGASFEVTRGPRLMMPVGLGGLVATMEQAPRISGPGAAPASMMSAAMPTSLGTMPMTAPRAEAMRPRAPALPWLASRPASMASTTALGAAASAPPAALSHVAWSDRWLARFAGASPRSLETLSVATVDDLPRVLGLAHAAPGAVFVSPSYGLFDAVRDAETVRFDSLGHPVVTRAGAAAPVAVPFIAPAPPTPDPVRVDDRVETPDEVFAAISAAATQKRAAATAPIQVTPPPTIQTTASIERSSIADTITNAAPSSPAAGLSAHLAASPFAPALRHVLSIPSATSFDVRALFGGALSASYLSGLIAPEQEMELESSRTLPAWATWGADAPAAAVTERATPAWDAAYVAPDDLSQLSPDEVAAVMRSETPAAATSFMPTTAPAAMTTLRSALLSWDGALTPHADGATATGEIRARMLGSSSEGFAMARELVASMSLPMLGDVEPPRTGESWAAPGMMAERAHSWSVAQERSSADLSFDFVSPELLLAARVYGLGPAEAAQAARLAIAGPGQLAAMAGTVDRTFVQAMAFEAERRERATATRAADAAATRTPSVAQASIQSAYPTTTGDIAVAARVQPSTPDIESLQSTRSHSTFGVERKSPRGAFLWPQATVAALKLDAPAPDGQQSMSIAALELLAAQTVAELGTYAALAEPVLGAMGARADESRDESRDGGGAMATGPMATGSMATGSMATGPMATGSMAAGAEHVARGAASSDTAMEPSEADVLQAAVALVPMSRRARFDALYLALGRTSAGISISPAARAARALALAGRGDDAPTSAYERAATAWDVLPVVYAVELGEAAAAMAVAAGSSSTPTLAARSVLQAPSSYPRESARDFSRDSIVRTRDFVAPSESTGFNFGSPEFDVDVRPGMAGLSARAGEALGSYVAPSTTYASAPSSTSSSSSSSTREVGAVLRPPTAAQEMVQTGRPAGRFGGGEVEIPTWFEAAARKMFESQSSTMGDGISMAEMTLINAVPSTQIAASSRGTASHASPMAPSIANQAQPGQKIDIEKIANEIYRQILAMMDAARARNGEPYL